MSDKDDAIVKEIERGINALKYPWINPDKSINDIPAFPFQTFDQLKKALQNGSFGLDVSYPAARELSKVIKSPTGQIYNLLLLIAPVLMMAALTVAAIVLGKYVILLGIPISIIASIMGNPVNPFRGVMSAFNWVAQISIILAYLQGYTSITWLLGAFIVPFVANRLFYESNVKALREAVQESEPLFVDLFEKLALQIHNNKTHEVYRASLSSSNRPLN